jgi:hypothetical protein
MHDDEYTGPERRLTAQIERRKATKTDIALMVEEAVDERVSKMESHLIDHINQKFGQLHRVFDQHVTDAFPGGDARGHREHHQSLIDSAEVAKRVRQDLFAWLLKGVVGVVLFLIGIGALEWLKRELSK